MLTLENNDQGIIHIRAAGKLTKADYDRFAGEFEQIAKTNGPVRVMIELDDFQGWDVQGFWEEVKFDIAHEDDLGRVAVIGDKSFEKWGTKLSAPFFSAEMRYFDKTEVAEARDWLMRP